MPGGRPAVPVALHLMKGNKRHLTAAEIKKRQQSEVKLGDKKLVCPSYVRADKEAHKKWKEIVKLYKNIDFVSSADVGMMARYCVTFSEYLDLLHHREKIRTVGFTPDEGLAAVEALAEKYGTRRAEKMFEKIEYVLSVSGLLNLDKAINAKMNSLVQMEDRMFLNPLAKAKNIPKEEPKKADPLGDKGFGNV